MRIIAALLLAWLGAGCTAMTDRAEAYDPWEGLNRKTFAFNDAFDRAIFKPVAKGYQKVTPAFAREASTTSSATSRTWAPASTISCRAR